LILGLAACGSAAGDGDDPDPQFDAGPDAAPDPRFDAPRGEFLVSESLSVFEGESRRDTRITGFVLAGDPVDFHVEAERQGSCRLLTFEVGFCDDPCDGICDAAGVCHPLPTRESIGAVRIEGLAPGDMTLSEPVEGTYYNDGVLPEDIFDVNTSVSLVAGDFEISAGGPVALEADLEGERLELVAGVDAEITWTPGGRGDRVRLTLRSPNQAHGLPPSAIIECDGPDTGSFAIPGAWISRLPDSAGLPICVGHDCPPSELRRYRAASADDIDLVVASERSFMVAKE
jgi:hypothetical protein